MGANRSSRTLKKSKWAKSDVSDSLSGIKKVENCQKHTKNTNFVSESLVFLTDLLDSRADHSHRSFLKSESLATALLYRATWANCSRSLFKWAILSKRVNSQPWHLGTTQIWEKRLKIKMKKLLKKKSSLGRSKCKCRNMPIFRKSTAPTGYTSATGRSPHLSIIDCPYWVR